MAFGMLILATVKLYILASLMPMLLSSLLSKLFKLKVVSQWLLWTTIMISGVFLAKYFGYNLFEEIAHKQADFIEHSKVMNPGSYFSIDVIDPSFYSFIKSWPAAIFNSLLRPVPWQINSVPELILLFENILLLVIIGLGFKNVMRFQSDKLQDLLRFVIPVVILIGLTTPVLGAIMRYRAPLLIPIIVLFSSAIHLPKYENY